MLLDDHLQLYLLPEEGYLEVAIGIEPMNKGFAEIFSQHSQKNTEDQVGTRTTSQLFLCSSLAFSECRCLLHFLLQ
jgi:hypothetical protein